MSPTALGVTLDIYTASVPGLDQGAADAVAALFDRSRDQPVTNIADDRTGT